jgi:hypothetical protein
MWAQPFVRTAPRNAPETQPTTSPQTLRATICPSNKNSSSLEK